MFTREIRAELSATFPKSLQELLPGYLPLRPTSELTSDELRLYKIAYEIITDMVAEGIVQESLVPVDATNGGEESDIIEKKKERRYKLPSQGGKRTRDIDDVAAGEVEPVVT